MVRVTDRIRIRLRTRVRLGLGLWVCFRSHYEVVTDRARPSGMNERLRVVVIKFVPPPYVIPSCCSRVLSTSVRNKNQDRDAS